MRLAIQDSWPNLPVNAEREFIKRFQIACENVGVECSVVVTSDDILAVDPSAVLVSHEFSRKLTGVPTIGMIWSPLSFFQNDPYRVKSLLSYDGYLAGNAQIQTYLKDLQFGVSARKPVSKDLFLPTTYKTDHVAVENLDALSLSYVGVHWDGTRHRELFDELIRREMITCYGPEKSWKHITKAYGGFLPIDGRSVIQTIASHGLALCLHKAEHRAENTPSMRLFEALSVGALPICDDIGFARDNLSEFVEFIDFDQGTDVIADSIARIIEETRDAPDRAIARAKRAKKWFDANWSLEHKIENVILPLIDEVRVAGRFSTPTKTKRPGRAAAALADAANYVPDCEIVIRTGGRTMAYLERAVQSVKAANSPEFKLGLVMVDYRGDAETAEAARRLASPDFPIRYVRSPSTGFRSTALWDGIKAVKAPFVAHMDDDDSVFENHYRQLSECFARKPEVKVCYSGVIKVEDEPGFYTKAPNFDGPLDATIEERRNLHFLEHFTVRRLAKFENFIQSNTWMARRDFIQDIIGDDPELEVVEDIYLYLLMATAGAFGFTGSPTAQWHWRSATNDNSMRMIKPAVWDANIGRIRARVKHLQFNTALSFDELTAQASMDEAPGEIDKRTPDMLAPLNFNRGIEGGSEFKNRTIMRGFHQPEGDGMGVWSKDYSATMVFTLAEGVREQGGKLIVEYIGSMNEAYDRWIEMGVEGGDHVRAQVLDWSLKILELPFPPGLESAVILKVTSSHLVEATDAHGTRQLGCFLRSIRVVKTEQAIGSGRVGTKGPALTDVADRVPVLSGMVSRLIGRSTRWMQLLSGSPVGGGTDVSEHVDDRRVEALTPLDLDNAAINGAQVSEKAILRGFHSPEGDRSGVWSKANSATIAFGLGEHIEKSGGVLIIDYAGSSNGLNDRWIEFGLDGEAHQRVQISDWSLQSLKIPLQPGYGKTALLKVTSSHLVEVTSDLGRRQLGCFIKSLRFERNAALSDPVGQSPEAGTEAKSETTFVFGPMPQLVKSNLRLEANSGGVLIVLGSKNTLHLPPMDQNGFTISRQAAYGAAGFLHLPDKPTSAGDVHIAPTDRAAPKALSFAVERPAKLCEYSEAMERAHLAAIFPPGAFGMVEGKGYIVIEVDDKGRATWKVRPSQDDFWTLLYEKGSVGEDTTGLFCTGELPSILDKRTGDGDDRFLFNLSMAVVAGCLASLLSSERDIPDSFLIVLARSLLVSEDGAAKGSGVEDKDSLDPNL